MACCGTGFVARRLRFGLSGVLRTCWRVARTLAMASPNAKRRRKIHPVFNRSNHPLHL